jgi:hypothetical protein
VVEYHIAEELEGFQVVLGFFISRQFGVPELFQVRADVRVHGQSCRDRCAEVLIDVQ